MSYKDLLKSGLTASLESETAEVEATPEEMLETDNEIAVTASEVEDLNEQRQRAELIESELANQETVIENIVEQNGELTPTEAALLEGQRRALAVAAGIDPDSEAGANFVDSESLESMVNPTIKGRVALEEAKEKRKGVWETIKGIFRAIVDRFKKFFKWVSKFTNYIPGRIAKVRDRFKEIPKDKFDEVYKLWLEESEQVDAKDRFNEIINKDGSLVELDDVVKLANKVAKDCFFPQLKLLTYQLKLPSVMKDEDKAKGLYEDSKKVLDGLVGTKFEIGVFSYEFTHKGPEKIQLEETQDGHAPKPKFTYADILDALNTGKIKDMTMESAKKRHELLAKLEKTTGHEMDLEMMDGEVPTYAKAARLIVNGLGTISSATVKLTGVYNKILSEYATVGTEMVTIYNSKVKDSKGSEEAKAE